MKSMSPGSMNLRSVRDLPPSRKLSQYFPYLGIEGVLAGHAAQLPVHTHAFGELAHQHTAPTREHPPWADPPWSAASPAVAAKLLRSVPTWISKRRPWLMAAQATAWQTR